jgi:predicted RNase H-like HicB family nuclease
MTAYIALIHKDADSEFGASFPDFPGCVTAGSTLDEVREMAVEALTLHIEGMLEDGVPLPEPSSFEAVMAERENREAVALFVTPRPVATKAIRVNVTLPEDVLTAIDRFAADHGLTRSGFLARAARRELAS